MRCHASKRYRRRVWQILLPRLAALPAKIFSYLEQAPLIAKSELALAGKAHSSFEKILILLREQTGHDFSFYKNTVMYRRIERRMSIHRVDKIATYVRYLQENPQEVILLFKELLIGVTSFFVIRARGRNSKPS